MTSKVSSKKSPERSRDSGNNFGRFSVLGYPTKVYEAFGYPKKKFPLSLERSLQYMSPVSPLFHTAVAVSWSLLVQSSLVNLRYKKVQKIFSNI